MCTQIKYCQAVIGNIIMEMIKWGYRWEKVMPGTTPELLLLAEMWFWYEHHWHVGPVQSTAGLVPEHLLGALHVSQRAAGTCRAFRSRSCLTVGCWGLLQSSGTLGLWGAQGWPPAHPAPLCWGSLAPSALPSALRMALEAQDSRAAFAWFLTKHFKLWGEKTVVLDRQCKQQDKTEPH